MEGTGDDSVDQHWWREETSVTRVDFNYRSSDGDSDPKKSRSKRHVFTPLEKEILVNLYNTNNLKTKKDVHDEVLLLSKDDRSLSETQVKTWVDNYKTSLNRKKQSNLTTW